MARHAARQNGARGNFEEYKHPCLVNDLDFAASVAKLKPGSAA